MNHELDNLHKLLIYFEKLTLLNISRSNTTRELESNEQKKNKQDYLLIEKTYNQKHHLPILNHNLKKMSLYG